MSTHVLGTTPPKETEVTATETVVEERAVVNPLPRSRWYYAFGRGVLIWTYKWDMLLACFHQEALGGISKKRVKVVGKEQRPILLCVATDGSSYGTAKHS